MTREEAIERAREVARLNGLNPEDTSLLLGRAARWASLDAAGIDAEIAAERTAALRSPSRSAGAVQLLGTMIREEAVIANLPDEARESYTSRMTDFGPVAGITGGLAEWSSHKPEMPDAAEVESDRRRAAAEKERVSRAEKIAELYKNPAMLNAKHPDHGAVVAQLVKLHEEPEG